MRKVNDWRETVNLPILKKPEWTLNELESRLTWAINDCADECIKMNKGAVCTTLSGGLDSSFCLEIIRKHVRWEIPIVTQTIGCSQEHPDIIHARVMASRCRTFHRELIPLQEEIKKAEAELYSIWKDEPREGNELGNVAVYLVYRDIAKRGFKCVIAHDGIDELLGGYWMQRDFEGEKKEEAFMYLWERLVPNHLFLIERKAKHFGIKVIFPYLQKEVVEYISLIPLDERTSRVESKIPLRRIAAKYLSKEIIERKKVGFCDALKRE